MLKSKSFRLSRVVLAIVMLAGICAMSRPDALAHAGLDFWSLPTLNQEIEASTAEQEQMDADLAIVLQRMEIKDQIAMRLADGDIDLRHAAILFRNLYAVHSTYRDVLRSQYPRLTEDMGICRNVIAYTDALIAGRTDRTAIRQRLENDFTRLQSESHPLAASPATVG